MSQTSLSYHPDRAIALPPRKKPPNLKMHGEAMGQFFQGIPKRNSGQKHSSLLRIVITRSAAATTTTGFWEIKHRFLDQLPSLIQLLELSLPDLLSCSVVLTLDFIVISHCELKIMSILDILRAMNRGILLILLIFTLIFIFERFLLKFNYLLLSQCLFMGTLFPCLLGGPWTQIFPASGRSQIRSTPLPWGLLDSLTKRSERFWLCRSKHTKGLLKAKEPLCLLLRTWLRATRSQLRWLLLRTTKGLLLLTKGHTMCLIRAEIKPSGRLWRVVLLA